MGVSSSRSLGGGEGGSGWGRCQGHGGVGRGRATQAGKAGVEEHGDERQGCAVWLPPILNQGYSNTQRLERSKAWLFLEERLWSLPLLVGFVLSFSSLSRVKEGWTWTTRSWLSSGAYWASRVVEQRPRLRGRGQDRNAFSSLRGHSPFPHPPPPAQSCSFPSLREVLSPSWVHTLTPALFFWSASCPSPGAGDGESAGVRAHFQTALALLGLLMGSEHMIWPLTSSSGECRGQETLGPTESKPPSYRWKH